MNSNLMRSGLMLHTRSQRKKMASKYFKTTREIFQLTLRTQAGTPRMAKTNGLESEKRRFSSKF
jgi:hypothetical protein